MRATLQFAVCLAIMIVGRCAFALEPIPDKLVVLTFDDSVRSHFTVVRPILKDYEFGATFFITEGFDFKTNKRDYMTWQQITQLHKDGFEIGNHTRDHVAVSAKTVGKLKEQLAAINARCKEHGIPRTTSFAYPGNGIHPDAFAILKQAGIRFARRGGAPEYPYKEGKGFAYEPGQDHPLLIPSAGDARPAWTFADFLRAIRQAKKGRVAVLQFHGVPDLAHPWVHTPEDKFRAFMKYLHLNGYKVIALRDLAKYVDDKQVPKQYDAVIERRKATVKADEQQKTSS
jgi:peptidoglycan/xylan/chitin deacetylase (PgdA/CDA1 family)